jgi:hypothetical protein
MEVIMRTKDWTFKKNWSDMGIALMIGAFIGSYINIGNWDAVIWCVSTGLLYLLIVWANIKIQDELIPSLVELEKELIDTTHRFAESFQQPTMTEVQDEESR